MPCCRKPNIVLFGIDSLSARNMSCYGYPRQTTPHMDRFASQGIRFAEAHTNPPCCPSRTALLLAKRPSTTKVFTNNDNWCMLSPNTVSMPEHLRKHGYEMIRIGKIFHGGGGKLFEKESSWDRVIEESDGLPPPQRTPRPGTGPGVEYAKKAREAAKQGKDAEGGTAFIYGPTGLDDEEDPDGRIATQAIKVLNQKQEKPLFLAVGFHRTHLPFRAPDKYFAMYPPAQMVIPKNPNSGPDGMPADPQAKLSKQNPYTPEQWREAISAHFACLSFVDAQVGRVLDALEKSGRADKTIVVIWSDHGFMLGEHFLWRKGPLRDESTMSVLMMRAPGVTQPGSVCKRPVECVDIFPTLLDLCGISLPEDIEAVSMKPLLENPSRPWKKGALMHGGKGGQSIVTERWRYNEFKGAPDKTELFDQDKDPGEFTNLAHDPQHADVVADLHRLLAGGWRACLPAG